MHIKSNRLYIQCVNDPLIYAIETTSAIVVKTIRFADDYHITLELRNTTFTISPCGSLIFTKSPHEDQVKCIRISNEEIVGQFRIPISLSTKKYSCTSLCYHPSKDLISCSIFGDTIHSCLFLLCHESEEQSKRHGSVVRCKEEISWEHDLSTLQQWYNNRSQDITNSADDIALDSILSRIDDLFFMAIRSPKSVVDTEQLKDMQTFLQKFDSAQMQRPDDEKASQESQNNKDEQDNIVFLNDGKRNDTIAMPTRLSFQMQSTANNPSSNSNDTKSNSSRHTFNISKGTAAKTKSIPKQNSDDANTLSDGSEPSNRTFEVPK